MSNEISQALLGALRRAIEIAMPDFRHYYRQTRKAKVVAVYPSTGGQYFADVKPLRNDETEDDNEPVIPKVAVPVIWGGPERGVVCPPVVGVHCDLSYYDGDPNYPFISNMRWHSMKAPAAELNEFVIQLEPGVEIRIDKKKQIVTLTPENIQGEAGKNWIIKAGDNATIIAGKEATMEAGTTANIVAPFINLRGRITARAYDGKGRAYAEFYGDVVIRGNEEVKENTTVGGSSRVAGNASVGGSSSTQGNSYAGTRSGGGCPHQC